MGDPVGGPHAEPGGDPRQGTEGLGPVGADIVVAGDVETGGRRRPLDGLGRCLAGRPAPPHHVEVGDGVERGGAGGPCGETGERASEHAPLYLIPGARSEHPAASGREALCAGGMTHVVGCASTRQDRIVRGRRRRRSPGETWPGARQPSSEGR